jgi:hypothetical protein
MQHHAVYIVPIGIIMNRYTTYMHVNHPSSLIQCATSAAWLLYNIRQLYYVGMQTYVTYH